jgi:hypothetical protein
MKPCLFEYATKELSQDAFFCWLLAWSQDEYEDNDLNIVANNIIKYITNKNIKVKDIEIFRQYKDIDFYIRLNDEIIIVFEDKIKTTTHDNQLKRYREIIQQKYPDDETFYVYIKSDLVFSNEKEEVEEYGYKVLDIYKINDFLVNNIQNDIYMDYRSYLKEKIKKYNNFEEIKYELWGQDEWYGFIYRLTNVDNIEYERYGLWQGRELWLMLEESDWIDNKKYYISLEIKHSQINNIGRLTILLHIEDNRLNKTTIKENIVKKLTDLFANENVEINYRTGKQTAVITFNDFPVKKSGEYIDYLKTKKYLLKIINKFKKF